MLPAWTEPLVREWLKPLAVRLLRRPDDEIAQRSRSFGIRSAGDRARVAELGRAFLGGYHAMLGAGTLAEVAEAGAGSAPHLRPFFFEGAAMGYLPRGYYTTGCGEASAERDLLGMNPAFRYLYYVGLGFWYGLRHKRHPERLRELAAHVDPLFAPLCWDGFGFKLGFFDFSRSLLDRCPEPEHRWAYQGFGRALFFVYMDDWPGFERLADWLPVERRLDLEFGRSLAFGFTGVDRPDSLVPHVAAARDPEQRAHRLLGVTWALTARRMNDPAYFEACLAGASRAAQDALRPLPDICNAALDGARSYESWQHRTRDSLSSHGLL